MSELANSFNQEADEEPLHPTYAGLFHCIGSECEDACCGDWDIPLDKVTYERYRQFPHPQLSSLVTNFVSLNPVSNSDSSYAYIHRAPSGKCPFYGDDRLCGVQKLYGPGLLSASCSLYPRSLNQVNGQLEGTLILSCPEAARLVLLNPSLLRLKMNIFSDDFVAENIASLANHVGQPQGPPDHFLDVRSLAIELIRDRTRPMWQNILLVASFCKRLDEAMCDLKPELIPGILDRYRGALRQGPSGELADLPRDLKRRIELTITLTNEQCSNFGCGQRFKVVFWDFIQGIGSTNNSTPDDDMERFRIAEEEYYLPLLYANPFWVENYLVNYMLQHLFPYGRGGIRSVHRSAYDESLLLAVQFSWVSSLLIGIAGWYRDEFSTDHIVATIQSFTRTVGHAPQTDEDMLAAVKRRGLDDLAGISILLRT